VSTTLPVIRSEDRWLAGVLTSAFESIRGVDNRLGLPRARRAIVLLVDGLGSENLKAHRAYARTLSGLTQTAVLSNFPSTTASSLATLTTGADPGQTGMLGYAIRNPETGLLVNQLSGLDDLDTSAWQPVPTVWESNSDVASDIVSAERYRSSGLTRAILRGGNYVAANTYAERMERIQRFFQANSDGVIYVYIPELDQAAHSDGVASDRWVNRLEQLDGFVAEVLRVLGPHDGLLVTADHGVLDVPSTKHRLVPGDSVLLDDVQTGGEPRFLHLYSERDPVELAEAWRAAEGSVAHVATRAEAIAAGWFGAVATPFLERIGDVLVTPRGVAVYYDERTATPQSMAMVGQHGGLSTTETHVPLVRAGVFG
jgi:hypothetical protein